MFVHAYETFEQVELLCEERQNEGSRVSGIQNQIQLVQQTPVGGLSAAKDEVISFFFEVPTGAGSVSCGIFGSSGDADLILMFGDEPVVSSY